MEIDLNILKNIIIYIPGVSSLTFGAILFLAYQNKLPQKERLVREILLFYYLLLTGLWFLSWLSGNLGNDSWYLVPLIPLCTQILQVLFFHFISILICTEEFDNKSYYFHYYIPVFLFAVVCFFYYQAIPQFKSIKDINRYIDYYLYLSYFLYTTYYTLVLLPKLFLFKKQLFIKHPEKKKKYLNWLLWLIGLKIIMIFFAVFFWIWLPKFIMFYYILIPVQNFIMLHNTLLRNYIFLHINHYQRVLVPSGEVLIIQKEKEVGVSNEKEGIINQKEFEQYFEDNKPYLNSELKITDISIVFDTNRTYLSKFINETYGINFKSYINQWRLKEVEELLQLEKNRNISIEQLVQEAGFGSIRTYWRVKKLIKEN